LARYQCGKIQNINRQSMIFPPSYYAFRVDIRYNQQTWKCFSFVVIYDINIVRGLKGLNWKPSR